MCGFSATKSPQVPTTMTVSFHTFDTRAACSFELLSGQRIRPVQGFPCLPPCIFRDMFSLPQPSQPAARDNTLPITQVTASTKVFDTFLLPIHPLKTPAITSLQRVDDLFRLADRYVAKDVHAKVKRILARPSSFLRSKSRPQSPVAPTSTRRKAAPGYNPRDFRESHHRQGERLHSCTESGRESKFWHGSGCKVPYEAIDRYFTVLDEMGKVG